MNSNRMNVSNNLNFQQNIYQQPSQFDNNNSNNNSNYNNAMYQNSMNNNNNSSNNNNNMYMGGNNFNNSPYNMNMMNKGGYGQVDFKRISLDKEKQQNFDINVTDINGKYEF